MVLPSGGALVRRVMMMRVIALFCVLAIALEFALPSCAMSIMLVHVGVNLGLVIGGWIGQRGDGR